MQFGLHLVRHGLIRAEDFAQAVELQIRQRPPLGTLAMENRKLSMRQVFEILSIQAETQKPFGRVAVELGFLSEPELMELLGYQSERCQSLAEVIVVAGILDQATVDRELHRYRRKMMPDAVDGRITPTEEVHAETPLRARSGRSTKAKKRSTAKALVKQAPKKRIKNR